MGICMGTEQQNGSQVFERRGEGREAWLQSGGDMRFARTPPDGHFPMHNSGHVKFEVPKVPVIFVLGGPGSGKVTHCDNLMQEKRGITHINMTDLLQQYAVGNDMKDFGQLSSTTVTEVLMLEMKMAPAAKTYLVSGYPRSMRDVVEYSDKIQIVNGVVLVSWRQKVLERQIDYGAKLGHVVLGLAKMELNNFYKNVMPVAEYFDQRGMLQAVNGERNPSDVYKDFRAAILRTLGVTEKGGGGGVVGGGVVRPQGGMPTVEAVRVEPVPPVSPTYKPAKGFPLVLWVIGGPGSNKSALCQKAVRQAPGWVHLSVGRLLRATAETTDPRHSNDTILVRQSISAGEMVPEPYVLQLVESQMTTNMSAKGIVMDGFPRDMSQVYDFENKFKQQPVVVLLDCSKLQLGRGRLDDSVAAFRRRLELFREVSLPMLRTLDTENRLLIVDGDTDTPAVQEEFNRMVLSQVELVNKTGGLIVPQQQLVQPPPPASQQYESEIRDIEADDEAINTISRHVAHANGVVANGVGGGGGGGGGGLVNGISGAYRNAGATFNVARHHANGGVERVRNGLGARRGVAATLNDRHTNLVGHAGAVGRPSRDTIRDMYANVESYPMDSQL